MKGKVDRHCQKNRTTQIDRQIARHIDKKIARQRKMNNKNIIEIYVESMIYT